jgi:membrane protease YdiL (CAAX protease family)
MSRAEIPDFEQVEAPKAEARQSNKLPVWVILILVLFVGLRITEVVSTPTKSSGAADKRPKSADAGVDSDSIQDLIQTDLATKGAFLSTYSEIHPDLKSQQKSLGKALRTAELFERESHNSPSSARRVIILRALLGKPPFEIKKHGYNPLDAFTVSLPAGIRKTDLVQLGHERALWTSAFGPQPPNAAELPALTKQIATLTNLRWWKYPALLAIYRNAGDHLKADTYIDLARTRAVETLVPVILIGAFRVGLILIGFLLIIALSIKGYLLWSHADPISIPTIWATEPQTILRSERKLNAGDLLGAFVIYLAASEVIGSIFAGLTGFGVRHVLAFEGVVGHYQKQIDAMSSMHRSSLLVLLESIVYVISAAPPIGYLIILAKKRGADLGAEIGWTKRNLSVNALYGLGGFAIASTLMVVMALLSNRVFKHAPDPSNPVIPMMVGASGIVVQLALLFLAAMAAPFVEELLFRGALYNALKLTTGVWPAIIISGCVFGFIHPVGIAEMTTLAVFGMALAWLAETRKSLVPGMVAHCLQNLTTTLLLLFIMSG